MFGCAAGPTLAPMIARIIQMQAPVEDLDKILSVVKERVVPAVRSIPGFRSDTFAADRATGRIVSFVLWEDMAGADGAEALFQKMRGQIESLGLRFDAVENLEVVIGG